MKTSSKQLSSQLYEALWDDLTIMLADTKQQAQMSDFLNSFLTETEKTVLIKRLGIIKRLYSNYSYEEIQQELQVSSATISVASKMKDAPAVDIAIEKLAIHAWADQLAHKVLNWFKH